MKILTLLLIFSIAIITGAKLIEPENSRESQTQLNVDRLSYNDNVTITEPSKLATYSTPILTDDENRYNNIKIVSDRLDGFVLEPGKEFSFNEKLGPYGKDDGFLEAKILLSNGTESIGYGGGVCQLSTTLYNAIKELNGIEITEHHHHSAPVAYVPKNQDATVSLQSNLDFKFKNNNNYAIKFETMYDPDTLTVIVYKKTSHSN